jgi:hypothetical protein
MNAISPARPLPSGLRLVAMFSGCPPRPDGNPRRRRRGQFPALAATDIALVCPRLAATTDSDTR